MSLQELKGEKGFLQKAVKSRTRKTSTARSCATKEMHLCVGEAKSKTSFKIPVNFNTLEPMEDEV